MPEGNPEGYDVGRITDAAAADIKAAEKAKKKAKKAKKAAKAKDVGRITNKARGFVGVMGRFPGGRLRD